MKTLNYFTIHSLYAVLFAAVSVVFLFFLATVAEPQLTHGQADTAEFSVQQTITGESSFAVPPSDVVMTGSINGVTGGQATGTTEFSVLTNNAAGYQVEIDFFDNVGSQAMRGDTNGSESIIDYTGDVGAEPSRGYGGTPTSAQFAYTVESVTPSDTDLSFFHPAGAGVCGQSGSNSQADVCWKAPDTTAFTIVERTAPALTVASSSVIFSVVVPNSPSPALEADTYTATATLSLITL